LHERADAEPSGGYNEGAAFVTVLGRNGGRARRGYPPTGLSDRSSGPAKPVGRPGRAGVRTAPGGWPRGGPVGARVSNAAVGPTGVVDCSWGWRDASAFDPDQVAGVSSPVDGSTFDLQDARSNVDTVSRPGSSRGRARWVPACARGHDGRVRHARPRRTSGTHVTLSDGSYLGQISWSPRASADATNLSRCGWSTPWRPALHPLPGDHHDPRPQAAPATKRDRSTVPSPVPCFWFAATPLPRWSFLRTRRRAAHQHA
jgi:hypothetical protein